MEVSLSNESKVIIASIRQDLDAMRSEFSDLKNLMESKNEEISVLKNKVFSLEDEISTLKEDLDGADQYERKDTVIFSGSDLPTVANGEIVSNIVCDLVREKLQINILANDISTSHRIGKKPNTQVDDKRNIIVKLCRRDVKNQILSGCRRQKPANMYINESLTPLRSKILYVLRKMKRETNSRITGTGSNDGKVFIWVKHQSGSPEGSRDAKILVNTRVKLEEISQNLMRKPLSAYIKNWSQ